MTKFVRQIGERKSEKACEGQENLSFGQNILRVEYFAKDARKDEKRKKQTKKKKQVF